MAIQVSPGINVSEIDLTTSVPAVSTTEAAIGGVFNWGPIGKLNLIDSENTLVSRYGTPTDDNYETFYTAANFLAYGNKLYVSRAAESSGFSNTLTTTLNGNTTATIANNSTGITVGLGVYGTGIPDGTTVSNVSSNATTTIVTLSTNATVSSAQTVNFYNTNWTLSAVANSSVAPSRPAYVIKNSDHFESVTIPSGIEFVAKYPGEYGNSLKISVCGSGDQYSCNVNPYALVVNSSLQTNSTVIPGDAGMTLNVNETTANLFLSNSATLTFSDAYVVAGEYKDRFIVGDYVEVGNTSIGKQQLKIKSISALANTTPLSPTGEVYFNLEFEQPYKLSANYESTLVKRNWEFYNLVDSAPGTSDEVSDASNDAVDQLSVVIVDEDGKFTKTPGTVLEVYQNLSRVAAAKNADGGTNYYKTVINDNSRYVWSTNDLSNAPTGTAAAVADDDTPNPYTKSFVGAQNGVTESTVSMSAMGTAYDLYQDNTSIDISLVLSGKAIGINGTQLANYLVDNIAEVRQDCVVYVSPPRSSVVGNGVVGQQVDNVISFRNNLRASSYQFIDSGYKYQYDRYNDVHRYIPLNGDIAGLTVRTDDTRDPWYSPAGFNRGQIKNIVRLAWNPNQGERDQLYKKDINPVVTFPGQGTILYGDKTGLAKSSAFDRINVRRLFIILRKSISKAAQQMLFEFNDEFTRAQFKNLVEPFLRDVQGRRGIVEFRVVCDDTNNPAEVIDANRFVGDIYIRPARSINFISLNFVAVRSGVEFSEVAGSF